MRLPERQKSVKPKAARPARHRKEEIRAASVREVFQTMGFWEWVMAMVVFSALVFALESFLGPIGETLLNLMRRSIP
jgi:hypothetical protein